jgi:hypothetical protein
MPFEEFDKRSAIASKTPFVTIQMSGLFTMNGAAYELMGKPEAVTLLYDKEEQLIGFKPANKDRPRAYPVRPMAKSQSTYTVAGQAFKNHYGIDTSVARRYGVEMRDGVMVVDLKSESIEGTGPRRRGRQRETV